MRISSSKKHDWLDDIRRVGASSRAAPSMERPRRKTPEGPGRILFVARLEMLRQHFRAANRFAQIFRIARHFISRK